MCACVCVSVCVTELDFSTADGYVLEMLSQVGNEFSRVGWDGNKEEIFPPYRGHAKQRKCPVK